MYNSNDEETYFLNGEATSSEHYADDAHSYTEDYDDDDEGYLEFDDEDDDDEAYLEDFEYLDDDDDEAYLEYDDDDDESVDDVLERRRRGRYRRRRSRSRFRYRRPRAARGKVFRRSQMRSFRKHGVIRTPAGTAKVKLPANIATKHELKKIDKKVIANNKAVLKNGKAISVVDKNLKSQNSAARRSIKKISRRVGSNKKALEASRQASMLTSMLGSNSLETIKLLQIDEKGVPVKDAVEQIFKVKDSTSDSMASLLPLMMGGSGSSDMSSMLPMIMMANSSSDKDSDDNSSMMMAMAMMMSAKK